LTTKTICIVGAGTAGALASALIAVKRPDYKIINVRSNTSPTIQVGESTTPIFIKILDEIGILEDFYLNTNTTPKHGVKFLNWFNSPNFLAGWPLLGIKHSNLSFIYGLKSNKNLGRLDSKMNNNLIPYSDRFYSITALHIGAVETYNFILDKFKDKITTYTGNISYINKDQNTIKFIELDTGVKISADEWIDCTGFNRVLIGEESFEKITYPPVNSAIAGWSDTLSKDYWTTADAAESGWMWTIPLKNRTAFGYVYNNNFCSKADARIEVEDTFNLKDISFIDLSFTPGSLRQPKNGNVTAIGLSAGFIDALDATSLHLTCLSILNWLKYENDSHTYNSEWNYIFDQIQKYIQYYYTTSTKVGKFWDSIPKLSDEEVLDIFKKLISSDILDISGFSSAISIRMLANRIKVSPELVNIIDNHFDFSDLLFSTNLVLDLDDKYVPYTDDLYIKWLKYTGSLSLEELAR